VVWIFKTTWHFRVWQ